MAEPLRAIIFDCFGVLATDGWLPFKQKHFAGQPVLRAKATELNQQNDRGRINDSEFAERIAAMAGVSVAEVNKQLHKNVPNPELFEYIRDTLKPRYKIGLLSNASGNHFDKIFSAPQKAVFDAVALSFELGFIKPERRAYEVIAELLAVEPTACVLIDDQERHCNGARAAGMQAIVYEDFPHMKAQLERLLADP
jgi:HAD superfamily hydrolase (TIGR01509 family)